MTMTKETKKPIPAQLAFEEWHKDPAYVQKFKSLEDEFELAQLFIQARGKAGLTQQQLADRMQTSQAYVARLESGKEKPSTRTLSRFAKATGHRIVINFEPLGA